MAAVTTFAVKRQIGRLELEALIVGERTGRLDLPPLAAEHVGRVGDIRARLIQIEDRKERRRSRIRPARIAGARRRSWRPPRQELAGLGVKVLLGLPQRCLGRLQARIGAAAPRRSSASICVEWKTLHHSPGMSRPMTNCCAAPPAHIGRNGRCRRRVRRITSDRRGRGRRKVGSDRASGQAPTDKKR